MILLIFFALLTLVFLVVHRLTRPTPATTRIEARLVAIRNVVRNTAFDEGDHQLKAADVSFRARTEAFFAGARALRLLRVQSATTLSLFEILAISAALAVATALAVAFFTHLYLAVPAAALATLIPAGVLRWKRNRRVAAFELGLPETIDLMARALRAGHSVQQMLEVVALETRDPIRAEFAHVHKEQKLGIAFRDAMEALAGRVPSQDLRFVVTAILVQKETGGDLIEILDRTAFVIRDRARVAGEVRTLTAEGRMTGWILSLLPVILLGLMLLITPGYATILIQESLGHLLLGGGAFMILLGAFFIRKIVAVEV